MATRSPRSRRSFVRLGLGTVTAAGMIPLVRHAALRGAATTDATAPYRSASTPAATPGATPTATGIVEVGMTDDLRFDPESLTIQVGTTVRWINDSPMPHTATGDPAQSPVAEAHPEYIALPDGAEPWGSELLQPGESYSHTFAVPGEYHYICIPHVLSGMRGTIIVEG